MGSRKKMEGRTKAFGELRVQMLGLDEKRVAFGEWDNGAETGATI